ncbi:hypothetical protein [Corynebacterium lubricantis]|uniref:hypothetical protein n=1 Tax=Corynebacterium lubricantis TaxID=541095 RepID=UPI000376AD63|nr:hypothetical protein [Corynebacterium lubricantis]
MPSMFPSFSAHPDDRNRRYDEPEVGDDWPRSLQIGFWLIVAGAIMMVLTAMLMVAAGFPGDPADTELRDAYMRNMWFMAIFNVIVALVMGGAASYLRKGSKNARRVVAVCIALACFFNALAFALRVGALSMMVIVVLLAFAALFIFRPTANAYISAQSNK